MVLIFRFFWYYPSITGESYFFVWLDLKVLKLDVNLFHNVLATVVRCILCQHFPVQTKILDQNTCIRVVVGQRFEK